MNGPDTAESHPRTTFGRDAGNGGEGLFRGEKDGTAGKPEG